MLRFLPVAVELFLLVFCLVDAIQTPQHEVRNLNKLVWILLILFFPIVGGVAWLVAGRPQRAGRREVAWPASRTAGFPEYERPRRQVVGPEDDPEFLAQMQRGNAEQEALLRRWEEDLRRRERELGTPEPPPDGPPDDPPPPASG